MHPHKLERPIPGAQPAYLANGLIGLRIPQIPLPQGTALVLQEIAVMVDRASQLILQAHLDQRGLPSSLGDRCMPGKHVDGILRWVGRNGLSSVGAAYASEFIGEDLEQRRRNDYGHEQDMELAHTYLGMPMRLVACHGANRVQLQSKGLGYPAKLRNTTDSRADSQLPHRVPQSI